MSFKQKAAQWQHPPFDAATQKQVDLLHQNPKELEDAFYKDLEFGTGGIRGVMGVGTNRINKYTLGRSHPRACFLLETTISFRNHQSGHRL